MDTNVSKIQAMHRARTARKYYQTRLRARAIIQLNVYKHIQKRKWQKSIELHAGKFLEIVIRIQKEFRWRRRWGMILDYVERRKQCATRI